MSRVRMAAIAMVCICCLLARTGACLAAQTVAEDGLRLYGVTCAGCHGADGRGTGKGAAIATLPAIVSRSDAELARAIHDGVRGKGMPAFPQLGDDRVAALVRYVRTLQSVAGGVSTPNTGGGTTAVPGAAAASSPTGAVATTALVSSLSEADLALLRAVDVQPSDLYQKVAGANWVSYHGDYSGRRFSSLAEVTPENAKRMTVKWRFHTKTGGVMEATPVVVDGVMFVTRSNDVYALNAATGKLLWHHTRAVTEGLIDDASGHINRGVAVLGAHVYVETDNAHLLCLDAHSGGELWDVAYAAGNRNYGATSAPLIVKEKVLVSASGGDDGVRGFVAAYDASTGKEAWRFWSIPAPGEKGSESWPGQMYLHGGGTMWMPGTFDAELNTVYWGTGNPAPDFNGSGRPGDDLYTSSVVALDADSGELRWHFQYSPHDLYDYDSNQTPVLVDAVYAGRPRKLIVAANRNGFLYILDRTTGEYLASKQFIPMLNWAKGIDTQGRPISNNLVPDAAGVTVCPSVDGGTNWYSPSYDPETNTFYFRSLEACSIFRAQEDHFAEGQEYYGGVSLRPPESAPEFAKETSYLNAFSLATMDFAWRRKLGGDGHAWAGAMSTAGGVVGFGNDAQGFELDDARTGKALWSAPLGAAMHASPMSYGVAGRQYFAVTAGDDVVAFGLR